jgi:hypothetical protein
MEAMHDLPDELQQEVLRFVVDLQKKAARELAETTLEGMVERENFR